MPRPFFLFFISIPFLLLARLRACVCVRACVFQTTLLNSFLHGDKGAALQPKPTEGLDYTFARKSSSLANVERKDVANIWEVSGTEAFKREIASADSLFITPRQVATATVLVVLDLSKPWQVLASLTSWLDRLRFRLEEVYDKFNRRGSKIPTQLKARAKSESDPKLTPLPTCAFACLCVR